MFTMAHVMIVSGLLFVVALAGLTVEDPYTSCYYYEEWDDEY